MATPGSSRWRAEEWGEPCQAEIAAMAIYAGGPRFQANVLARPAFTLLGTAFQRHNYIIRRCGCYNCRRITGGSSYSSHAWGISLDVNDDLNPYRTDRLVTDMSMAMINDIYAIKTIDGVQVFRWGGDWDGRPEVPNSNYDAMHIEIIATPKQLSRGFLHLAPSFGDVTAGMSSETPAAAISTVPVRSYPVIRMGSTGPLVVRLQNLLQLERTTGNGKFGPRTDAAVRLYQRTHGLAADGIVGHSTWTALLTSQPPLASGAVSPIKLVA